MGRRLQNPLPDYTALEASGVRSGTEAEREAGRRLELALCFGHRSTLAAESSGRAHRQTLFCRASPYCAWKYCILYKLKVYGNSKSSKSISAIFSSDMCSLHVCVSHFDNSHNISNFFIITCFCERRSVIFNVSIAIVWGRHKPHPCKMANLNVTCVLNAPPISCSPVSLKDLSN